MRQCKPIQAAFLSLGAVALLVLCNVPVRAQTTGFVANPTTNSSDFQAFVTGLGATVNTNVNFDAHPVGPLNPTFYTLSDGVTLTETGSIADVQNGAGPGQGNTSSGPLSPGEGKHPASNFLFDGGIGTLTVSFDSGVSGVGLFTADYFNPQNNNPLTIEAFTGANGTGTSLGSFSSVAFNFQANNLYFMGLATNNGSNSIGSLVFTDVNTATGDTLAIDDIRFSRVSPNNVTPEGDSFLLLTSGLLPLVGFGLWRRGRRNA
jgi:hypothetical protein